MVVKKLVNYKWMVRNKVEKGSKKVRKIEKKGLKRYEKGQN